jgi:hypothetical protein
MLGNRKLILDTHCEIYSMIKSHADGIFWNLDQHISRNQTVPGAIYVIGREQLRLYSKQLRSLIENAHIKAVFSNPHEGSETLLNHCYRYGIADLVLDHKIVLVGGGDMDSTWPCLQYESFLPKVLDYNENIEAAQKYQDNYSTNRPYKFLFLNGRARPHRKHLLDRLSPLLDSAIWSNLDLGNGAIQLLHPQYEVANFDVSFDTAGQSFVKDKIFPHNTWGDVIIEARPYLDSYFSLVTETVHAYPHSFRTEKIWKPIAVGHPWIAVANQGFYRDMHNLGFRTFGDVIDESFDTIQDNDQRLERVAAVVEDLCSQDLASFLESCYTTCKYNQQHLAEMRVRVRQEFPDRFFQFLKQYQFHE